MQRKAVALRALKDASAFLKKQFYIPRQGTLKADGTLVSDADHGSEKRIMQALKKAFPDDAILSEESGETAGQNEYRWILDPLDGTHNFLAGIPIFGILLALEKQGDLELSFCVFPLLGEVFIAEKGKGAFLNGKRIRVSRATTLQGSVFLADGNMLLGVDSIVHELRCMQEHGSRFRLLGEGPFGMTRVALGTALATSMHLGKVWDIAAPALLVEEAGGKVTDLKGNFWDGTARPILATNGPVHDKALSLLKEER